MNEKKITLALLICSVLFLCSCKVYNPVERYHYVDGYVQDAIYDCYKTCGFGDCTSICDTNILKINDKWYNLTFATTAKLGTHIRLNCEINTTECIGTT